MDVHDLGEGEPEVAVVGAIHGDEPCGARAVRRLLDADLDLERPVRLIVANEAALDAGVRYLDADLNRSFPGDPDAESHEARLDDELLDALDGCSTLAIHSTQSYAEPFAVVDSMDEVARAVAPHLPVDVVIQTDAFTGGDSSNTRTPSKWRPVCRAPTAPPTTPTGSRGRSWLRLASFRRPAPRT